MALPREYENELCPVARSLEVVGERWTLLIVRDAFYGVVRFTDFQKHLQIPPAVLTERLRLLLDHGIMATSDGDTRRREYALTRKGELLWPVVWAMMNWGNEHYVDTELRRAIVHFDCGGELTPLGDCGRCGSVPPPCDLEVHPRRGKAQGADRDDRVSRLLRKPHRFLVPLSDAA